MKFHLSLPYLDSNYPGYGLLLLLARIPRIFAGKRLTNLPAFQAGLSTCIIWLFYRLAGYWPLLEVGMLCNLFSNKPRKGVSLRQLAPIRGKSNVYENI